MVTGFTKSKEGVAEYKKIGLPYPDSLDDELYEKWLKDTSAEDLKKYSPKHTEKEVTRITRLRAGPDDKEYLMYSFVHYRLDSALNVTHRWRPNIGMYPIPMALYRIKQMNFGKQEREVSEITSMETGYSIPFTKKNIEEIHNIGLESDGKVQYILQTSNGLHIKVQSYEDLRDGDFNELAHFGRVPNEREMMKWLDDKGIEKDKEFYQKVLRQRVEGDIPQKRC